MGYYDSIKPLDMRFEIYQDSSGQYRFSLKQDNGSKILESDPYLSENGCKNGVDSVRMNVDSDRRYDRYVDNSGSAYFKLKASNGRVICTSQKYDNKQDMENEIHTLMANAVRAQLDNLTKV